MPKLHPEKKRVLPPMVGCLVYVGDEFVPHLAVLEDIGSVEPCGMHTLHLDDELNTGAAGA